MSHRHDGSDGANIFAQLFEASPNGELVVTEDGSVRWANPAAHRILGWPQGTLVAHRLDEILPERFRATQGRPVMANPSPPSPPSMGQIADELIAHRRDGSEVPVEITLSAVRAGQEQLCHVLIRDLSAWHEARQKLRESEETFRFLVDGVRDCAIFFLDPDGRVMTWNAAAERIKGYRAPEIIGQSFVRFYLPQDVIAGLPSRLLRRATEQGVATEEGLRVRKDGSLFWAYVVVTALRDESGRLRGFAEVTRDISDQRHAEQSMAILADTSRLLAESLDSEQVLFTITHMAVPAFADGVAIHLRDSQGELYLGLYHAANSELLAAVQDVQRRGVYRVAEPSRRVMRTGRSELYPQVTPELLLSLNPNDELASVIRRFGPPSVILAPIILDGRPFAVIAFTAAPPRIYNEHDLVFAEELARRASTAMHNAELFNTAKRERERSEEAAALRERLVAVLGHDLRNPLSAISMAAQMLSSRARATVDEHLVSRVQRSANRMMRMIDQILDFARIRSGQNFDVQLEFADLGAVCQSVVDELRLISRSDQEITLTIDDRTDARFDSDRIAQVLSNLIGNAIQYGTSGPIDVAVREVTPDAVAIEVHNFGPAIPKDVQAGLFEAFHRETPAGSQRSHIGLGLFIANEIVRAHGGSIAVRSPERNGTTFSVFLPRGQAGAGLIRAESAPPQVH
jgi:PAS domain S-box-containing protein